MENFQDIIAQAKEKLRNKEKKQKIIVITTSGSKEVSASQAGKVLHDDAKQTRQSMIAQARREAKASAIHAAQEDFVNLVAADFQALITKHGDKLRGTRIIFLCGKSEASSDYHIRIEDYPQTPRTLHKRDIEKIIEEQESQES